LACSLTASANAAFPGRNGRIAFVRAGDIWTMKADGTGQTRLTFDGTAMHRAPRWSPDGSRIAFVSSASGDRQIYAMNADGSDPERLTFDADIDNSPAWSWDGTQILFEKSVRANGTIVSNEIWAVATDGSRAERNVAGAPRDDGRPGTSPRDERIVFSRSPVPGATSSIFTLRFTAPASSS
jgi:tricorn protease-like protein